MYNEITETFIEIFSHINAFLYIKWNIIMFNVGSIISIMLPIFVKIVIIVILFH